MEHPKETKTGRVSDTLLTTNSFAFIYFTHHVLFEKEFNTTN